jgi:Ino eighty subunit 2
MRLTVKTSSNKLREATQKSSGAAIAVNSRDQFAGRGVLKGKRARNVKKSYVVESDSDEDEEMVDIADDDDAEGESVEEDDEDEEEEEEEEDEDALGEEDADGDVDMDIRPPPPIIKISRVAGKQTISVKPPKGDTVTVEQKEMEAGSDDEELSELDSDLEVEEEEGMQEGEEEEEEEDDDDAEGEDEEVEVEDDIDDEEEELDSDDETPINGSRASTPDLKSLTKRQRARLEEGGDGDLMALPDGMSLFFQCMATANIFTEVQVKKHLTAEEHAMRRAEMARRRKNLSEKRNEEEKVCLPSYIIHSTLHLSPPPLHPFILKLTIHRWKRSTNSSKNKPPKPTPAAASSPAQATQPPIPKASVRLTRCL